MKKSSILLSSINQFYADQNNRNKLLTILNKSGGISLRNLEWFITNYAKKNNTSFKTKDGKVFTVHTSYKSSLDGYSKKLFDPFLSSRKVHVPNPRDFRRDSNDPRAAQLHQVGDKKFDPRLHPRAQDPAQTM